MKSHITRLRLARPEGPATWWRAPLALPILGILACASTVVVGQSGGTTSATTSSSTGGSPASSTATGAGGASTTTAVASTTSSSGGPTDAGSDAPHATDACYPATCLELGYDCGIAGDGCGNTIDCGSGTCAPPSTCGGGGVPNVCGVPCTPTTCAGLGYTCGPVSDGCTSTLDCGPCPAGQACGAGGVPGQCSSCASSTCVPVDCEQQAPPSPPPGWPWGPLLDGCGSVIECGSGPCSWAPLPGCCGVTTDPPYAYVVMECGGVCVPLTCGEQGICCGKAGDGCGNVLDCGPCEADGGPPPTCPPCVPRTCASEGFSCGPLADGCGGTLDCGSCDPCIPCVGGACTGTFVAPCAPKTCADQGVACGPALDGCCNVLDCGDCQAPLTCAKGQCLPACM